MNENENENEKKKNFFFLMIHKEMTKFEYMKKKVKH